jgi:hypothetical protein
MERYKQEIIKLTKKLTPRTPPKCERQREQEATVHVESIAQEVKEVAELYNRTAQIWTSLKEDEKILKLEQREEKLNVVVQDLKKRKKKHGHLP